MFVCVYVWDYARLTAAIQAFEAAFTALLAQETTAEGSKTRRETLARWFL